MNSSTNEADSSNDSSTSNSNSNSNDSRTKTRRHTDLTEEDIDCLIKLCDTRLHTINLHLRKNAFADNSSVIRAAAQIQRTNIKLKEMKERKVYA